jgi:hypothetical protein
MGDVHKLRAERTDEMRSARYALSEQFERRPECRFAIDAQRVA